MTISSLYSKEFEKNKYSTEIDCEYSFVFQSAGAGEDFPLL